MANDKKVLLQISGLKQYFPINARKNIYVRANDGISIDIYEGEAFGLVGESGCGKSTLGRSVLQLYKQTDGRTMYFGRSIDEVAPKYAYDTFRTLTKRRELIKEKQAKYDEFKKEYDSKSEKEQYELHSRLVQLRKEANDAILDVTTLIGGLILHPDLSKVEALFCEIYKYGKELRRAMDLRELAQLDTDDAAFALKKAEEEGKATEGLKAKL